MVRAMQRVMIVGQPGAGKSTFARKLGAVTGLPVVHIDHIHWKTGWVERERVEKTALCREVHARPEWIFEGGHSTTWGERLERADTLIWLDRGLALRVWRVVWRTLRQYGKNRPDLPDGCPEQFSAEFYGFIWRTRRSARRRMAALVADAPGDKTVLRFRSNREEDAFLKSLQTVTVPPEIAGSR